jgi:hypothetical protein
MMSYIYDVTLEVDIPFTGNLSSKIVTKCRHTFMNKKYVHISVTSGVPNLFVLAYPQTEMRMRIDVTTRLF